jgi:hypothetical protein
MNSRTLALLGAIALAGLSSPNARAQNSEPTPPAQPAPATQSGSPDGSSAAPAQAPAKKVWTNDDMGDLRDRSSISTVGSTKPASGKPATNSAHSGHANANGANSYRAQITKLQSQLPPLDQKINDLQSALAGNQVPQTRQFGGLKPDDWKDQLARLQKQRDDIQTKIAALEDQARHSGAPTNQIP